MSRSIWGRFDDVHAGDALRFGPARTVITAYRPDDVAPALARIEQLCDAGAWAFGFLAYEAAEGLNPEQRVPGSTPSDLPLLHFGIGAAPTEVAPIEPPAAGSYDVAPWTATWSAAEYAADVEAIRAAIAAGSTYQCNLTVRLASRIIGNIEDFYADLVHRQRCSYAAYLDVGDHLIASASPELFFSWAGPELTVRPMKGTARRGRTTAEDEAIREGLRRSEKERAENIMIVDLLRNDLGRIAEVGSVRVTSLCVAERYETVWQLTSEIVARARPDVGLLDVLRGLFPSGSVTGAPKRRAMGLIAEREHAHRGVYCGAIGYIGPRSAPKRAHFNVAIRTAVVNKESGAAIYGTGGAVTWDSTADQEHAELLTKAEILRKRSVDFQLFETMAYLPESGVRNLVGHLARLEDSARYFDFRCDLSEVSAAVEAVEGDLAKRLRLTLQRSGRVGVEVTPMPPVTDGPVRLVLDRVPVDSSDPALFHKTTRRQPYEQRAARHPGADDVVLINELGQVTETTIANIAIRLDGRWVTPTLTSGCLPGVERARLLSTGAISEASVSVADLLAATGLAVFSSLRGWRPAILTGSFDVSGR